MNANKEFTELAKRLTHIKEKKSFLLWLFNQATMDDDIRVIRIITNTVLEIETEINLINGQYPDLIGLTYQNL